MDYESIRSENERNRKGFETNAIYVFNCQFSGCAVNVNKITRANEVNFTLYAEHIYQLMHVNESQNSLKITTI